MNKTKSQKPVGKLDWKGKRERTIESLRLGIRGRVDIE